MKEDDKKWIDNATYEQLLRYWRFGPMGAAIFQGESGNYYAKRMKELRSAPGGDAEHIRASKVIGWKK